MMTNRLLKNRRPKIGAPPGTLVHIGQASDQAIRVQVTDYDQDKLEQHELKSPSRVRDFFDSESVSWVRLDGVHQVPEVQAVGNALELHSLVLEDILNTDQRPKLEFHDDYLFLVLKAMEMNDRGEVQVQQISIVIGRHFVLSALEKPGPMFDSVMQRLEAGRRIRFMGTDYLAYALVDVIIDQYFAVLENIADQVEQLENQMMIKPTPEILARIHHLRREMLLLRKVIWPLREVLSNLTRSESGFITDNTRIYLRDVYDHVIHALDTVETLRDLLVGMLDLYLSSASNRLNEIMKVLTLFATLFMPLTFIVGVYGMNFEYMPELVWRWGYPAVLLFMLTVVASLLFYFRSRKWL